MWNRIPKRTCGKAEKDTSPGGYQEVRHGYVNQRLFFIFFPFYIYMMYDALLSIQKDH